MNFRNPRIAAVGAALVCALAVGAPSTASAEVSPDPAVPEVVAPAPDAGLSLDLVPSATSVHTGQRIRVDGSVANTTPDAQSVVVTGALRSPTTTLIARSATITLAGGASYSTAVSYVVPWWLPRGLYTVDVTATGDNGTVTGTVTVSVE